MESVTVEVNGPGFFRAFGIALGAATRKTLKLTMKNIMALNSIFKKI